MSAQTPAEGIMKVGEYGDAKFYKVACQCGSPDHDIDFEVEAEDPNVNVNIYVKVKTDYWTEAVKKRYDIDNAYLQELDWTVKDIINGFVTRLKLTWRVWTQGYLKTEVTVAMTEQQALNYAETLKSAVNDVKSFKEKNRGN